MKLFLILAAFLLASCEQIEKITETVDNIQKDGLNVTAGLNLEGMPEWSMKQVDSIIYLRETSFGTVTQCIVLDASGQTLYSSEWTTIPEQDDLRLIQATSEQIVECGIN
jgi:hypothetical protein